MFHLMPRRARRAEGALARGEMNPLELLRREFASLFDRVFPGWPVPFETPAEMMKPLGLEMREEEMEVVLRAEVPGFEASELDVQVAGDVLTIRAEHKEEAKDKEERRFGRLERTVTLPAGTVPEKVEARYRNGVLEVHVPKVPEAQARRIDVKT